MDNINILQGKERCPHCLLTPVTAGDYLAFYLCHATVGEDGFSQNSDCLARTLLAELEQPVETLAGLREKIALLKKSARPGSVETHTSFVWSE